MIFGMQGYIQDLNIPNSDLFDKRFAMAAVPELEIMSVQQTTRKIKLLYEAKLVVSKYFKQSVFLVDKFNT